MPRRTIRTFTVLPQLPEILQPLHTIAYNLWWCWHQDALALFSRIDIALFDELDHSPIKLLGALPQERFEKLAKDAGFIDQMQRVFETMNRYMAAKTWWQETYPDRADFRIAYFSAEFGIHESVPVYSGGLGILAGDHLKSASDLGVPLCGVSLMYREGYFRQYLNIDGWQQELYPENDFFNLPLILETKPDGSPLLISVPLPGREVFVKIWRIQVGRVPLYLLDCNIPQNRPEDRGITAQLYGGDQNTRIQQEIVLGIGGIRALKALGKPPTICHMNEGHSAFCGLERIRATLDEEKCDFATAVEAVKAGTCFTTHTPVPAGNDAFPEGMMDQYFGGYFPSLKIDRNTFLNLGREKPNHGGEPFSMTVLAINLSNTSNGVSKLHGRVSRHMWNSIWPGISEAEVPITSITNGIHTQTWIAPEIEVLCDRYLGRDWAEKPMDHDIWKGVEQIPDGELWRTHERRRERLVALARKRLKKQLIKRGSPPSEVDAADEVLDPEALTIGFARRFATYKRGTLVFRYIERLAKILHDPHRPVQLIFSGKAHPKDNDGKRFIAEVVQFARKAELRGRVVFLEDYDMNVARHLVQGVDVWLNNPRRPLEASGTSGMKVCCNGGLNLSILDGWWDEGYLGDNGWAIGAGEEYTDTNYQDEVEGRAIYELIEKDIVPLFYNRGTDGLPRGWIHRMKRSIATNSPVFNTNRMVAEYAEVCYLPALKRHAKLVANHCAGARELAAWRGRLRDRWSQVRFDAVEVPLGDHMRVGQDLSVEVRVHLGDIPPAEVEVQLYHGAVDNLGGIPVPQAVTLKEMAKAADGNWTYRGTVRCGASGQYGYGIRVLPKNELLPNPFEPNLITWA